MALVTGLTRSRPAIHPLMTDRTPDLAIQVIIITGIAKIFPEPGAGWLDESGASVAGRVFLLVLITL